jgi:hypothetical protein
MHAPHVSGMPAVATAEFTRRAFENDHLRTLVSGANCGAEPRIAAANDQYIGDEALRLCSCGNGCYGQDCLP